MSCPNINSQQWKDLVAKIGVFDAMKEFIRNNEEIPNAEDYQESFKGINATMKIVTALQKTPRSHYPSNSIQGFYNDLIKQGAPKDQIELLKQYIANNNIKDINTNDLIVGLLSEMSYTIEINTIKKSKFNTGYANPNVDDTSSYFVYDGLTYEKIAEYNDEGTSVSYYRYFKYVEGENNSTYKPIDEDEFNKARKASDVDSQFINSDIYSNLTVPGGTNYTENEIATPQITPSIKGHAQFSTKNGIGWFRADEQIIGKHRVDPFGTVDAYGLSAEYVPTSLDIKTNTRRILEVQSDLFQKGRDRDLLIDKDNDEDIKFSTEFANYTITARNRVFIEHENRYNETINLRDLQNEGGKDAELVLSKIKEHKRKLSVGKENDFLQLLNKDNNWQTFFVKSIIQDSAKKGYEKVLFPTGDTAAKIEGHETIKEFIKGREIMIFRLEAKKEQQNNIISKLKPNELYLEFYGQDGSDKKYFNTPEELLDYGTRNSAWTNPNLDAIQNLDSINREINQFKKEIEDAKAGKLKISSIHKFYEDTIFNILKKQGYSPERIKDEYDNEWYEIRITPQITKELINFNKPEDNSIFNKQILKYLQDKGIVSTKEFPAGSGNFYIKKTITGQDRNNYAPEEVERKNLEKINDINQRLGYEAITTTQIGNGLVVKFNSQLSLFDRFDEELLTDLEVTQGDREYFNENIFTTNARDLVDNVYRVALMINKPDLINIGTILKQNEDLLAGVSIESLNEFEWKNAFPDEQDNETSAAYYASTNSIQFSQKYLDARSIEKNIRVIMEELLHALTVQPFHKQDNNIKLNPREQKFVDSINKLYNHYKENAPRYLKESYRFTNAREFIIGMTLDPNFKDHLEQIDKPGFFQKLITDFVNAILQFFGIKTNKEIYPFEKLTLNYINDYISGIKEIRPLLITSDGDLISGAKDISTEKEELKKNLTEDQKNRIKEKVKTFINQIKSISGTSRFSNPEIKNAVFHIGDDYKKFSQDDIDMIDFFFNFTREINSIFDSLNRQIEAINTSRIPLTDNVKLSRWNRIISTARDFDSTLEEFRKIKAELFKDELVAKEIEKLIIKRSDIEDKYFFAITPLVVTHLSDIIEPATQKALSYLDDEIDQLSKRIDLATKSGAEKRAKDLTKALQNKVKEREEKYNISKDKVQDYIRGLLGDSNTLSSFLEASIVSSNPVVSGLTKYIKDNLHKSDAAILQTANETQTELELYEKNSGISRNNLKDFNEPLLDTYDVIKDMDDEYNITTKKKLALLSPWNMDYVKELQKFTFINNKINDKIKRATTEPERLELKKQLKENTVKRLQFLRDYMEMPYLNEVHEAMDLIHEDLGGYTAYEAIGQLYDEKQRIEEEIDRTKDEDVKEILYNNLDDVEFRIKEIRSTYEKDPESKEFKIANQLRKRDEALKKYRDFVLTTTGEAKFKLEKERIDKAFEDGEITQKDKDYWYQHNTVSALTDDYWKTKLGIIGQMNDLLSEMSATQEKSEDVGKLYNEIENIVKPYRDANGIIDGNEFNDKQVLDIKQLEEKIEQLKDALSNIFGLSKTERIELSNLNEELQNNDVESQSETSPDRLEFLRNEQIRIEQRIQAINGKKKTFNKKLVNKYFDLMKKLSALDTTTETHYYTERYEQEYDKYIDSQSLKGMTDKFSYNGVTYEKISNVWYAKIKGKSSKILKSEAEKMFKTKRGDLSFDQSEWYKNNHVKRLKWVKSGEDYDPYNPYATSGSWEESYDPIYIWRQTNPTNPKHKIAEQPSLKYKKSVIKDQFKNPNYKLSINGYNIPKITGAKDNKYINQRYFDMANATDNVNKARFRYLKYHTDLYNKAQEESYIPKTMRPGYDMPSVRPSTQERIQATSVSDKISEVGQWLRGVKDETVQNEQDKDILYGYLDNKGMIPMKFLGEIDIEDQSIDIARAIGMFYVAAQQRMRLSETYALVSSTADILGQKENTPVKTKDGKVVSVAKKFLGRNTEVAKHISGTSNTLKQVNEMINTFYFGEKIKDERGSKQLNKVLGLGANLMLGLNFGSMIQNWSNAKIQTILEGEAKLTKNFSIKDWTKAEATYWAHINELMGDLNKYGNKSYINQFIDYFGGINFNIINIFDSTSAYKGLSKTLARTLMPTEIAEHQLSYVLFMSIAMNTKVKIGDKDISLFDAFRIGDNGLELKEGVVLTQEQKDEFINKVNSSARRINGEYGNLDSPIAQKYMMGRLFLFMNKYFVPFFMRRFGKRRFNIQDGIQDDGFWRLFFRTLGHDIKTFQLNIVKNWKYYTPSEKAAIKQVGTEISISIILISMIAMLGGDDDKELKDNGNLANNIIYVLKGIKRQNEQFMLVPGLGLDDVYNRIKNPFPIMTKVGQAFSVLNDLVYLAGYSMGYNELKDIEYTKKSGWHNKGDLKLWTDLGKLLAGPNKLQQILHPDVAIKNLNAYRIK